MIKADSLRSIRMERGMSQTALARASDVSQPVIAALESGTQRSSKYLPRIAVALGVEMSELDDAYAWPAHLDVDFLER